MFVYRICLIVARSWETDAKNNYFEWNLDLHSAWLLITDYQNM